MLTYGVGGAGEGEKKIFNMNLCDIKCNWNILNQHRQGVSLEFQSDEH